MPGLSVFGKINVSWLHGSKIAFALLAITIAVALFVRCYGLETIPNQLSKPEKMLSQSINDVVTFGWIGLWSKDLAGQPTGIVYFMSAWVRAVDDDGAGTRFIFVAVGLMTIGMVFVFCRRFLGLRIAVLSAFLLAFSAWHIQFSRMALTAAFLPILGLSISHLLVSGLEDAKSSNGLRTIFWGGVLAGIGFYIHNAYWLFVVAMGVLWASEFLSGESSIEVVSRKALTFWLPVLIVALPYLYFLLLNGTDVLEYLREVSVTGEVEFQNRNGLPEQSRYVIAEWIRSITLLIDRFDIVSATLAVIGFMVGITRLKGRSYRLLWVLVPTTTLAAALTVDAGVHSRMIPVLPTVIIMAGVGLDWMLTWTKGRLTLVTQHALVALVILFIAWANLTSFHNDPVFQDEGLVLRNVKVGSQYSTSVLDRVLTEAGLAFMRGEKAIFARGV
ncbi:MAG: glycosyltransferase family 39 protein [SAR202 cluster bacterium]|nr:glycosyltransferase family 39 protein [SAR202 cluster bacterium]